MMILIMSKKIKNELTQTLRSSLRFTKNKTISKTVVLTDDFPEIAININQLMKMFFDSSY